MDDRTIAVIEKVKKLLKLADNNQNEHEAAVATAKAMELLAAHNLDMSTVKGSGKQRADQKRKGGLYAWQRDLWKAVAELNFCMYWSIPGMRRGDTYKHRVLGSTANVASVEVMADYLQSTVERLAQEWARGRGFKSVFVRDAIAYREGMAARLVERLQQIRKERLEEDERKKREETARSRHPGAAPTSNALVLADVMESEQDLNNDYIMGYPPGTSARNRAEANARRVAAQVAAEEALHKQKEWEEANPEEAAAKRAKEEADRKEWWENYLKKNKPRKGRTKEYTPRSRKPTAAEQRAGLRSFSEGHADADEIGLDDQIDGDKTKRIG